MKEACPAIGHREKAGGRRDNGHSGRGAARGHDLFHLLAESSGDLIANVRLAPELRVLYVNPAFCLTTGYTARECCENARLIIGHIHPDDAERLNKLLDADAPEDRGPVTLRGTKKDGTMTWLEMTRTVIRNHSANTVDAYFICRDVTARKLTEEALKESQEFISSLLQHAPHATVVINPDTSIRYVNPIWEEINGWRLDEVIGLKAPYPWWPEEQRELFSQDFKNAMEQDAGKAEIISRKKNGELYWIAMNWAWVGHGAEKRYMIINSVDITERKRAEEQLRLVSSVTEQMSESTVVTDPDFRVIYMNRAAQELFGYAPEEVLGKHLKIFNKKPLTEKARRNIREAMAERGVWSGLVTKRRKDGSTLLCDCRFSPLNDEKGKAIAYIDVHRDVTREKEAEAKLQEDKRFIENVLSSLPEGVMVTDRRDRVMLANQACYKIFHFTQKGVPTRPFHELIKMDELHKVYTSVRQGNAARNTVEIRCRVAGRDKIISCSVVKMDGERMLLIFTDVSQEREEKERLYLTDRLASIGEMSAGLAHELNNPLTAILTLSQLLLHHGLPGERQEDMKCIYEEAQRATRIVKNVLLFARNNSYEHGHSSANDVVRDVLRLRQYDENTSNITVTARLADDLPDIAIDRFQMQQVFLNIILNAEAAIKETGRHGHLTVVTEREDSRVKIHFTDNGCGIKKNVMPRIFDPFFTTKEVGKGTGLGLSICYGIVVKHGGKISVRSQAGKGATFTIEMPVVEA